MVVNKEAWSSYLNGKQTLQEKSKYIFFALWRHVNGMMGRCVYGGDESRIEHSSSRTVAPFYFPDFNRYWSHNDNFL